MDLGWTERQLAVRREVAFEDSRSSQGIFFACVRLVLVAALVSVALAAWSVFRLSPWTLTAGVLVGLPVLSGTTPRATRGPT